MCTAFLIIWFLTSAFMMFLLAAIFWIWMLADLLERKTEDKLVWTLVLLFLNIIGAIMYYFMVYSKPRKSSKKKR